MSQEKFRGKARKCKNKPAPGLEDPAGRTETGVRQVSRAVAGNRQDREVAAGHTGSSWSSKEGIFSTLWCEPIVRFEATELAKVIIFFVVITRQQILR